MRPLDRLARRTPLALVLLLAAGCASAQGGAGPDADADSPAPTSPDTREAADEAATDRAADEAERDRLEALYRERIAESRERYVEADVAFMSGMIAHHAQALLMVALVPERTSDPSIRTLAARIENAQRDEIALMERWLAARGEPVPDWHIEGTSLVVGPEAHARHGSDEDGALDDMPGMLSEERLEALAAATGETFDRLFLEGMIDHHRGAIEMVHTLLATNGAAQDPDVFRLASDVQVDQRTEIARMELMLRRMSEGEDR